MKLLMFVSNDLIDSVPLERNKIVHPGYIGSLIRLLREKHSHIIIQSDNEPEFILHNVLDS